MRTEAQKRARRNYDKRCRRLVVTVYPTEQDIRSKVDSQESYSEYIKGLIRADIARNG